MTTLQSQFFLSHYSLDIQKNRLPETKNKNIQHLKILILLLLNISLVNIQWLVTNLNPKQTRYTTELYVLCGGTLIFITLTIYLIWIMKHESAWNNTLDSCLQERDNKLML